MHTATKSKFSKRPCGIRSKTSLRRVELVDMMRNLGIQRSYTDKTQQVKGRDGKIRAKRVVKKVSQMCAEIGKAINMKPVDTSVNGYKPLYEIFKTRRARKPVNKRKKSSIVRKKEPMNENAAARVIQRFARRRVLPMKNAEGKFFTGFENKKPISRKYMIAIDGKLYDARNIMREVDQKYDDPHAIAMQELFESLPVEQKIAVRRRAGNYGRIFQNTGWGEDPQKYVNTLKRMGLPLDQVHYRKGDTSLHYAVMTSKVPLVKALLEGGANPNIKMEGRNNDKQTPLHLAVKEVHVPSKRLEIVNLLLQYGAKPNVVDKGPYRQTPLDIAAFDVRDAEVVRSLLAAGAKLRHYSVPEDRRLMTAPVQKAFENAGY